MKHWWIYVCICAQQPFSNRTYLLIAVGTSVLYLEMMSGPLANAVLPHQSMGKCFLSMYVDNSNIMISYLIDTK